MQTVKLLSQARFFVAALGQQRDETAMTAYMRLGAPPFLDAVGATVAPNVKAVPLPADQGTALFGLYAVNQGRRPGRRRDLAGLRKIGGLVTDETVAPACGLFEYVPGLSAPLPSEATLFPVDQIVRTDGRSWQVLARSGGGQRFEVIHEFVLLPIDLPLPALMTHQTETATPPEVYGLVEFLRRAMIVGQDGLALAKKTASYGRELAHGLMIAEDAPRLERFVHDLRERHGLLFGILIPERQAAQVIAYGLLLDTAITALGLDVPVVESRENSLDWLEIARGGGQEPSGRIMGEVRELFHNDSAFAPWLASVADMDVRRADAAWVDFCAELWRELAESATTPESFTESARASDGAWMKEVFNAFASTRGRGSTMLVLFSADMGNSALQALTAAPKRMGALAMQATASDPVAYAALRFRAAAAKRAFTRRKKEVACQIAFGTALNTAERHLLDDGMLLIVDFLPRFPSGAKEMFPEESFDRRFDQTLARLEGQPSMPAAFRLPAAFLDGKNHAAQRRRLFGTGRPVWVKYDDTQERPKDKRIDRASATLMLDAAAGGRLKPSGGYERLDAVPELRFSLRPSGRSDEYRSWPSLPELAAVPPLNGPVERRGMTLIDIDRDALARRVRDYLDENIPDEYIARHEPDMMKDGGRFNAKLSRRKIREKTAFDPANLVEYPFRPFDTRFAYLREMRPLFSDPASDLQVMAEIPGNWFLVAGEGDAGLAGGPAAWASTRPCDYDFFAGRSRHFPVWIPEALLHGKKIRLEHGRWDHPRDLRPRANLSPIARDYLQRLGFDDPDHNPESATVLWDYTLAVLYTPGYIHAHQAALQQGWPRLPLPGWTSGAPSEDCKRIFRRIAGIGAEIRNLLTGGDSSRLRQLSEVAALRRPLLGGLVAVERLTEEERTITKNWGVPAKGRAVRAQDGFYAHHAHGPLFQNQIVALAAEMNLDPGECLHRMGEYSVEAHLNARVCFAPIPKAAWDYTIGGRPVLKKWLSYRDARALRRPLTPHELNHFTDTARRLTALAIVGFRLDATSLPPR